MYCFSQFSETVAKNDTETPHKILHDDYSA